MISVPIDNIVSIDETKEKLKEIIDQVSGETFFVITKNNKPVSVLLSVEHLKKIIGQPQSSSSDKSEPVKSASPELDSKPTAFNTNFKPVEQMIKPKNDLPMGSNIPSLPPMTPPTVTPAVKPAFIPSNTPPIPAKISIPVPPIAPPKPVTPIPAPISAIAEVKPFTPASGGGNPLGITNNKTIDTEKAPTFENKDDQASPAQFSGETPLSSTTAPATTASPTPSTNGVRLLDLNQSSPTANPVNPSSATSTTTTAPITAVSMPSTTSTASINPTSTTTTPVTTPVTPAPVDTKKDSNAIPKDIEIG